MSPYSPNLASSNYSLFWLLSHNLRGVTFNNDVEIKTCLDEPFESKPSDYYRRDSDKLEDHWRDVVNNEGECIVEWFLKTINE